MFCNLQFTFIAYTFLFFVMMVNRWRQVGSKEFFESFWTLIDIAMFFCMVATIVFYVLLQYTTSNISDQVLESGASEYVQMRACAS